MKIRRWAEQEEDEQQAKARLENFIWSNGQLSKLHMLKTRLIHLHNSILLKDWLVSPSGDCDLL